MASLEAVTAAIAAANEVPEAEPAADSIAALSPPAAGDGSEADSASGASSPAAPPDGATTPEAPTSDPAVKRQLLEEKVAALREARRAAQIEAKARRAAAEAAADRKAAAEERAKFDGLKNGTFLETIKALGQDPRQVFEEMKREAIEANAPEAQIRRMQERFDAQLREQLEPLQQTIEELRAEKEQAAARAHEAQMRADFSAHVQAYPKLREEYDDADLERLARRFVSEPDALYMHAESLGLTLPPDRFTMRHILDVLQATQDAHEQKRQQRRAAIAPNPQATPAPPVARTVNGTSAVTTLGNDFSSTRASESTPRELTRDERVALMIRGEL
jgi:hypothetical protein